MKKLIIIFGALALLAATPAVCDTLFTQCTKHDCARLRCDDWGENCSRVGFLERAHGNLNAPMAHQTCNEFGDCHFWPAELSASAFPTATGAEDHAVNSAGDKRADQFVKRDRFEFLFRDVA